MAYIQELLQDTEPELRDEIIKILYEKNDKKKLELIKKTGNKNRMLGEILKCMNDEKNCISLVDPILDQYLLTDKQKYKKIIT